MTDRFVGGDRLDTLKDEAGRAVLGAADRLSPRSLSDDDLDVLEDVCLAIAAALRDEHFRRAGRKSVGWWDSRAPGAKRVKAHGGTYVEQAGYQFMDHMRKDRFEHGPPYYVSEPYHVSSDGIKEMAALVDEGWEITIDPSWALHYPGRTLAIRLARRSAAGMTP